MTETHTQTAAESWRKCRAPPSPPSGKADWAEALSALIPTVRDADAPRFCGSAALNSGSASPPTSGSRALRVCPRACLRRGCSAGAAPAQMDEGNLRNISLRSISLNPNQPRKEFGREELDDLTASIKEHGILQPIAVRRASTRRRRWRQRQRR